MACNSQGFWTPWWWLRLSGRNMLEWLNNNKLINPKLICAFCWFVLFFNSKDHYCTNKRPPLILLLRHWILSIALYTHVTIMLLSTSRFSKRSVYFRLCTFWTVVLPPNVTSHFPSSFDRQNNIWWIVQIRKHLIMPFHRNLFYSYLLNPSNFLTFIFKCV